LIDERKTTLALRSSGCGLPGLNGPEIAGPKLSNHADRCRLHMRGIQGG